jgi:transcriptional regulator with XRE-family HTH domain
MSIQERLQVILKMHNLAPSAFADKLGVQRSNVSHVLSGRNKPSLDFLEKIILNFPRVNANWLITGQMKSSESTENTGATQDQTINTKKDRAEHNENSAKSETIKIVAFYADGTFSEFIPKN